MIKYLLVALLWAPGINDGKVAGHVVFPTKFDTKPQCNTFVRKNINSLSFSLGYHLDAQRSPGEPQWKPKSFLCINEKQFYEILEEMRLNKSDGITL
tara:strand:+ start:5439 stop:5729 length:291 start_codon:yes stop_codon:yes gene_type:complete